MKAFRRLIVGLLILAILLVCGAVIVGWTGSWRLYAPQRSAVQDYEQEILNDPMRHGLSVQSYTGPSDTPCLLVSPVAEAGEALKGRAVRASLEKRRVALSPWGSCVGTVVMLHGLGGHKENLLPVCERLCAAGFRCVLLDLPAHGQNPAPVASFGKEESALVDAVMSDAALRFHFPAEPAFLFGLSQGGAIALQTAASSPGHWSGVISVAAFGSLDVPLSIAVRDSLPGFVRPASPLFDAGACLGAKTRAGYWPSEIRPVDAAAKLHLPVLIAHGDQDGIIPVEEARRLFAALPDSRKTFRLVAGANHGNVLSQDRDAFYPDLCEFLLGSLHAREPVPQNRGE